MRSCDQRTVCPECGRKITVPNFKRHLQTHDSGTFEKYQKMMSVSHDGLNCVYCGKLCKNKNSLAQHEIRCADNDNRIEVIIPGFNDGTQQVWNKGLTAAEDARVANITQRAAISNLGKPGRKHTEEEKEHLRECAFKNGLGGHRYGRHIVEHDGNVFDSSYEIKVAKQLDDNNVIWEKPKRFKYILNGVTRSYTPDFYLPDFDVYLDPKNDYLIYHIDKRIGITGK